MIKKKKTDSSSELQSAQKQSKRKSHVDLICIYGIMNNR